MEEKSPTFEFAAAGNDSHTGNLQSAVASSESNAEVATSNQKGGFAKSLNLPIAMPESQSGGLVNTANVTQQGSSWSKMDTPQTPSSCMTKGTTFSGGERRTKRKTKRRTKRRTKRKTKRRTKRRTKRKTKRRMKRSLKKSRRKRRKRRKRKVSNFQMRFSKMPPLKL